MATTRQCGGAPAAAAGALATLLVVSALALQGSAHVRRASAAAAADDPLALAPLAMRRPAPSGTGTSSAAPTRSGSPSSAPTPSRSPSLLPSASGTPPPPPGWDCAYKPHPWSTGGLSPSDPPYWRPDPAMGCTVKAFSPAEAAACLGNSTVYVMGNSIARGFFYELPAMLGAETNAPDRAWQKQACTKVPGVAGWMLNAASCTSVLGDGGARGSFLWRQWIWGTPPGINQSATAAADYCTVDPDGPERCLASYFNGSKPTDLLVINLGLILAAERFRLMDAGQWIVNVTRDRVGSPVSNPPTAPWPWLRDSVANLTAALERVTPIPRSRWLFVNIHNSLAEVYVREVGAVVNAYAAPAWHAEGVGAVDLRTIVGDHSELYADTLHIPGVLSRAFWHVALSHFCGVG